MSLLTIWHGPLTGRFKKMNAGILFGDGQQTKLGFKKASVFSVRQRAKSRVMPVVGLNGTVGSAVKIFSATISANTVFSKSIER